MNVLSRIQTFFGTKFPRFRAVLVVVVVTVFSFFIGSLLSLFPLLLMSPGGEMSTGVFISSAALSFVGIAIGGWVYLKKTGRGFSYIAVGYPLLSKKTGVETLKVFIACMGVLIGGGVLVTVFNIPAAEGELINELRGDTAAILLMIGVVFLFNAPVEEFLFRGIIQERLAETFHSATAIVLSSGVFAVVHLPGYIFVAAPVELVYPMVLIFTVSVVMGVGYWYTRNLVVVAGAHALYNAAQITTLLF